MAEHISILFRICKRGIYVSQVSFYTPGIFIITHIVGPMIYSSFWQFPDCLIDTSLRKSIVNPLPYKTSLRPGRRGFYVHDVVMTNHMRRKMWRQTNVGCFDSAHGASSAALCKIASANGSLFLWCFRAALVWSRNIYIAKNKFSWSKHNFFKDL